MIRSRKYGISFLLLLLLSPLAGSAQSSKVGNLQSYENDWLHFGFLLGVNSTNFIAEPIADFYKFDTLKSIVSRPEPGFNLGIIAEVKTGEFFRLRFLPDLSFAQRDLTYHINGKVQNYDFVKKVESTFLNFPLELKLRSNRVGGNFGGYLLAGIKYTYDLASNKDVDNNSLDPSKQVIKLKKSDWSYTGGAGIEFFLPYFKFAVELKASFGLKNVLINDNTLFSNSLEKLNSKVVLICFTFEG